MSNVQETTHTHTKAINNMAHDCGYYVHQRTGATETDDQIISPYRTEDDRA